MCQAHWAEKPLPLDGLHEPEGDRVPGHWPVIDAHVHLFPPRVYEAIWRWFGEHAWPIRYQLYAEQTIRFLLDRGVQRIVGLHYAHVPGMAASLNQFASELASRHAEVWALGTVLPGEPGAEAIVAEALGPLALRGLKLHCHVQRMAPDDPRLEPIYALAAAHDRPVVIHAGREPSSAGYGLDVRALCSAAAVRRVLERHPALTLVVPHLGADEIEAYGDLLGEFPNLWLDTTMMLAGYFPVAPTAEFLRTWCDRLLYGSDFPNLPYAWDRELRWLADFELDEPARRALLAGNATRLFGRAADGQAPA